MKRMLRQAGLLVLVFTTSVVAAFSQSSESRAAKRISELNSVILREAHGVLSKSGAVKFETAARERRQLLSRLVEASPTEALKHRLTANEIAKLPAQYADLFEKHVDTTGQLEVVAECEEHGSRTERFVNTKAGRFEVFFQDDAVGDQTGSTISFSGIAVDGKVAVETYSAQPQGLSNTTGEKRVLVILVNFQDKQTQPFTVDRARTVAFTDTSNYIREVSYGQTWLSGDVYGWYTIPVSSSVCDKNAIATYAKEAAANAGANLASYNNIVYGFPANACAFTGSANVGGTQPQMWVNEWFELGVVGHEFGHNLGLYHARSMDCGASPIGDSCTTSEYGDNFDLMGGAANAHYNLFQKELVGWVNNGSSPTLQEVSAAGDYWIDPIGPGGASSRGLKILKSTDAATGRNTYYYIEKRTAFGFDSSFASNANLMGGVVIHIGSDGVGQGSYLLDMTPETTSWFDPALTTGKIFDDPGAGVKITVLSADGTGALVRVEMNSQPAACVRANPTVSITPGRSNWVPAGASATYQVSVRNNNSGGCSSERFNLGSNMPSGLFSSFPSGWLDIANGASAVADLFISSSGTAADGTYNFGVSASNSVNSAMAASASAQHVIVSRLSVSASAGSAKYGRNQTALVNATVTAGGAPVPNATVTFTMSRPVGRAVSQTVMTGADGRASFSYKFNRKVDAAGTYTVNVIASFNGLSGNASASFVAK